MSVTKLNGGTKFGLQVLCLQQGVIFQITVSRTKTAVAAKINPQAGKDAARLIRIQMTKIEKAALTEPSRKHWNKGSKQVLTSYDLHHFTGDTLLDAVGRTICGAACLPRKELFESWEVARKVLRRARGGTVLDLACGHGLVGWLVALLDRRTPNAICVDTCLPHSRERLTSALSARWPEVGIRVRYLEAPLDSMRVDDTTRVLAVHACGPLTDQALGLAVEARARFAALPCCHSHRKLADGGLSGWIDPALAIDVTRVCRLRQAGYQVWTSTISANITPQNRLMIAVPKP